MATNKYATIRYHALDRCFSNNQRKYYIDDLIHACNDALFEYTGTSDGIGRRQVFDDIKFMESEQGWSVTLERLKDGKKVYYRYSDRSYSIKKQAVNELEANQLKETLSILTRFKGMPQFEWIEELLIRIESAFNLKGKNNVIVGFEQNPYLKGLHHFAELFNAIQYEKVLEITYQGYKQVKPVIMTLHPYYLKQYNNRWFLFGLNESFNTISNLALDRISVVRDISSKYIRNTTVNFDEYFEDVIGVTVKADEKPDKITLEVSKSLWSYIESKPIHGSQKVISKNEEKVVIELSLQINYEFTTMIFAFGEDIKVIEPAELKNSIKLKAEGVFRNYL